MPNHLIKKVIFSIIIPILLVCLVNIPSLASDAWETVGTVGGTVNEYSQFVCDGIPYVAYTKYCYKELFVEKYSGGSWQLVGEPFANSIDRTIYDPSIYVYNGIPYVAYIDEEPNYYGCGVTVKRYTDEKGWELVGEPYLMPDMYYAYGVSLFIDNGIPYVAFSDYSDYNKPGITVMKYGTENGLTKWHFVGSQRFSEGKLSRNSDIPALYVENGIPYVAFNYYLSDYTKKATVMGFLYDEALCTQRWMNVGNMPYTYNYDYENPSLYVDKGTIYVSFVDDNDGDEAMVMKYPGGGGVWEKLGSLKNQDFPYSNTSLTIKDGIPYLALDDRTNTSVLKYVENEWVVVGNSPVYSCENIEDVSLVRDGNMLYLTCLNRPLSDYGDVTVLKYGEESLPKVNITVNQSTGGYCSDGLNNYNPGTNIISVTQGSDLNLNFNANTGYIISSVYIDGALIATKPGITWLYNESNITIPKNISVNYALGYEVLTNVVGNGTVNGQLGYYLNNESVQLAANADAGNCLTYWLNNNTQSVYSTNTTVTVDSSTPHSFTVRFDPYYTYTSSVDGEGTITPSTDVRVTWDESPLTLYYPSKTFNIVPNSGYHIKDVLVDGVSVGAVQSYTFQRVELTNNPRSHNIKAIFAQDDTEDEDALKDIKEIVGFYEESAANGNLTGIAQTEIAAKNRLKAFENMLKEAQRLIEQGDIEGAIEQLQSAYKKVDGKPNPPDFIEGIARDELAETILDLIELLESLL